MKKQSIKKTLMMIFAASFLMAIGLQSFGQTIFSEDFNTGDNAVPVSTLSTESPDNIWTQEKAATSNPWNINVTTYGNTAGAAYIAKSAMTTNNSCLFSPGFTLTAGQAYEISFYVRVKSVANGSYNFKMGISDTRTSASITEPLYSSTVAITGYTKVVVYFIPEETKTYHLAFWENGNTTVTNYYPGGPITDGASIDDIDISQYTGSTTCNAPTNLALSGQNYSAATFTWDGTADNYNFLLKDKETSEIVFAQTVATNTVTVPRTNLKSSKEYEFGAASVCGPFKSADTAWGASSFTALADTFDYAMKFGYPLEQQNALIDNLAQIPLYIYNYSTIMISDTFRIKLIIDDTDIYNDSIIGAMISLGWNTNKNISLTNALSAGPHKIVAILSNNKDKVSGNDTAEVNFTIKSRNIALTQILHPTASGTYLTTDTLKVRVKNLNSHDKITAVSFNVKMNETVLGQYYASGLNILPGDSADIKYNKVLDLSEFGNYILTAFLAKDNLDNDQSNDTAAPVTITNNKPAVSFKDMFVTEVSIPTMPIRLTNSESISIKYVNKSGDSLDNFPIKLMVNGVVVKTDIIEDRTAGLGETHEHTFTGVDLSEYKEYVLSAFTALEGDEHPENDTATAEAFTNLEGSPDLPYFEDFEVEDGWLTSNDLGFASDGWSLFRDYAKLKISDNPATYKFDLAPKYASVERYYGSAYSSWMMSKGITLVEGEMYKIEFNLYTDTCLTSTEDQPFEKLIVNMGTERTAAAMTDTLFVTEERLYENEVITMTFTAKETGLHYLGFHAVSPAINYYTMNNGAAVIVVDNVSIKDSIIPAIVTPFAWTESFENNGTNLPADWTQERVSGTGYETDFVWKVIQAGVAGDDNERPNTAQDGDYKARLFCYPPQAKGFIQKLITPAMDLTGVEPILKFWHTQTNWAFDQDTLRVYYKTSADGEWTLLEKYGEPVTDWTKREIELPNPSAAYYIAFEGEIRYGYGIQLDNVSVESAPTGPIIEGNTSLDFGTLYSNIPKSIAKTYIIKNTGGAPLTISSFTSDASAISIPDLPVTINPKETDTITVELNGSGLTAGSFDNEFVLVSNDPETPNFTVSVAATVASTPVSPYIYETFTDQEVPEGWAFFPEMHVLNMFTWDENGVDNSSCVRGGLYGETYVWSNGTMRTNYVKMGADPKLSFMYKLLEYLPGVLPGEPVAAGTFNFDILVQKYGSSTVDTVFSLIKDGNHTPSPNFAIAEADVSEYVNEYCRVTISFNTVNGSDVFVYVDDVIVGTQPSNQLAAISVAGNTTPNVGVAENYTVSVKNLGSSTQSTYTVKLMTDDTEIASVAGESIAEGETKEYVLAYTPTTEGEVKLHGQVVLTGDEFPEDDQSPLFSINVQPADFIGITVGTGTETYRLPYNVFDQKSLSQTLYYPNELGTNGGKINSLVYYSDFVQDLNNAEVQVWIGETTMENLQSGWVEFSELTEVFDGTLGNISQGKQNVLVSLDAPYSYNGGVLVVYSYKKSGTAGQHSYFLSTAAPSSARSRTEFGFDELDPENPEGGLPGANIIHGYPNTTFVMDFQGMGSLSGVAKAGSTPLEGVDIKIMGYQLNRPTNASGNYEFAYLTPGAYQIIANKHGYYIDTLDVTITADNEATLDITLTPIPTYTVSGKVTASNATTGKQGATVTLSGYHDYTASTDASGNYSISGVYGGFDYTITAKSSGFTTKSESITVSNTNATRDFHLIEVAYPVLFLEAEENGNNAVVNWQAPLTTGTIRYDNGIFAGGMALNNQNDLSMTFPNGVMGFRHNQNAVLYNMSWYLTDNVSGSGSNVAPVNLFVLKLDAQGMPTREVIYSKTGVYATKDQWNTFNFPEPVEAPDGFFVAISHPTKFSGIGATNADAQYPFIENTYFYSADYTQYPYTAYNGQPNQNNEMTLHNLMIRAEGVVSGEETKFGYPETQSEKAETIAKGEEKAATYTPTPTGYIVYRLTEGQSEQSWTVLDTITGTTYTDTDWSTLSNNVYQYAVKAEYVNNNISISMLSNTLPKDMEVEYTVNITTNSGEPATGAVVVLDGSNGGSGFGYNYVYTQTADATGKVVFPKVWRGSYNLSIEKEFYDDYLKSGINISDPGLSHNAELIETIDLPYNLDVTVDAAKNATLTWNSYENFVDDMEGHPDFAYETIEPYTLVDMDGNPTMGLMTYYTNEQGQYLMGFPNVNYTGSFIVFNPTKLDWSHDYAEYSEPHSGDKFLACFKILPSTTTAINADLLITPKIQVVRGTKFKFWNRTYNYYDSKLDRFRIGVSTTGTDPNSFIVDTAIYTAPLDWTEFVYDLNEYIGSEVYVAIYPIFAESNTTNNVQNIFMVDDVFIGIDEEVPSHGTFQGYNVYLDGEEVATEIEETEYVFADLEDGAYTAGVQTVHSSGSSTVETIDFTVGTTGITIDNKETFTIYPNPVTNMLNIETEAVIDEIAVIDQNGKMVKVWKGDNKSIDLSSLPSGHYVVRIHTAKGISTAKIVKR